METVLTEINNYLSALDWAYMMTMIVISYFITNHPYLGCVVSASHPSMAKLVLFLKNISLAWKVFIIGIGYAIIVSYIRDYHGKEHIESLLQSIIFVMVFYKLLVSKLADTLTDKLSTDKTQC